MKKPLLLVLFILLGAGFAFTQNYQISGKVTDAATNEPLSFVTVVEKGSTRAAVTDDDGNYRLGVSGVNAVVIFQLMGYQTAELSVAGNVLNAQLQVEAMQIDEVLVVAYGSAKKSSYTGSATTVSSEKIDKLQISNVSQALQGVSAGVQVLSTTGEPGASSTVMIRGIGSMNASSSPLYVVDGVAFDGNLNTLNPADIESMTILKDAAATSLYGSRAANGVIMVTTKGGKAGVSQINFKATYGFSSLAVPYPRALNASEYYEMTWLALYNQSLDGGNTPAIAAQSATNNVVSEIKSNPFSIATPVALDGKIDPSASLLFEGDWAGELMKPRLRQEYTIDFSGASGDGNTRYFISAGYLKDLGTFTVQHFDRYSGRVNVSSKLKKWMEVGMNAGYSHSVQNNTSASVWFLRSIPSVYPLYEWDYAKGEYATDDQGDKIYNYGDNDRKEWIGWNPLADAAYNRADTYNDNVSTRTFLEVSFLPELKFRTNLGVDYFLSSYHGYTSATHGFAAGYGGGANKNYGRTFSYTVNNLLTYDKSFGDHHVSVLAGQEAYARKYNYLSAERRGFPFEGLQELASAAVLYAANSYEDNYRLLSWIGRAEYDYKNRYYISGSFRSDGSSRFSPDSRWGSFWSLGASWRMSEEAFMSDVTWVDNLKLKASYGALGNDNLSTLYAYQGLYATGRNNYENPGLFISALPNYGLKWETNLQLNIGLDFRLFNRIDAGIEWFQRRSKDLLFTQPMAPSTGFTGINKNIGTTQNAGIEFQMTANAIVKKDFRWVIDFNITHYKNKIIKLPQEVMYSGNNRWEEGRSRYDFWGAEWAGVNPVNGKSQWWMNVFKMNGTSYELDENGNRIVESRVKTENYSDVGDNFQKAYLGSAIPDAFGGLTNTFYLYGFDASFAFYYSIGGKLNDGDYSQMMGYRIGFTMHEDMLGIWTPENPTSQIPRMSKTDANNMNSFSSRFIYDNTFVRLRNVTLGYTLPSKLTGKLDIKSLRVFASGDNLLTFGSAAKRGTNPEQGFGGTTNNRFPTSKTIAFGVQVSF